MRDSLMLFIDNHDAHHAPHNLALEEYILRHKPVDESCLLFYVNAPSIIIGRNQNTLEEINAAVVAERGITVVRRLSGGGAVYHDLGNLNFSFITPASAERFNRYDAFLQPVLAVLREDFGLDAALSGRNDIVAHGRKISGNAQFTTAQRMFSHGTVLVDADLDVVTAALNPRPGKVESKGIKSIRSRVANVAELVREAGGPPVSVDALRDRILARIFGTAERARIPQLTLTPADWAGVDALTRDKYANAAWTYGEDPPSDVRRAQRFPAGEIEVRLGIDAGRLTAVRFYGDFQGREDVSILEQRLVGVRYDRAAITDALASVEVAAYFGDVTAADVVDVIAG